MDPPGVEEPRLVAQGRGYSFKVEFDHYDGASAYHGLDKLSLNNLIQDNTLMKDFLCYQLMGAFGVAAPLCSYASVSVNGEPWGLSPGRRSAGPYRRQ